jgi:hypothetical protein
MSDTIPATMQSSSQTPSLPSLSRQDSRGSASGAVDSRFSCNICLDAVVEPVVTQCGHLYCWPCLYRWLEPGMYPDERSSLGLMARTTANTAFAPMVDASRRVCPVCKSACTLQSLVPIYVRSASDVSPLRESTSSQQERATISASASIDRVQEPQQTEGTDESHHDDDEQEDSGSCHDEDHRAGHVEESTGISSSTEPRQRLRFRSQDSEMKLWLTIMRKINLQFPIDQQLPHHNTLRRHHSPPGIRPIKGCSTPVATVTGSLPYHRVDTEVALHMGSCSPFNKPHTLPTAT